MSTARRLFVLIACLGGFFRVSQAQSDTTRLSLLFIGDIMQHDSQINAAYDPVTGKYDYQECFQHVRPLFESVDVAIGNLEVTLAGPPYKGYPQFSAPDELVYELQASGIDVLVTANNHCVDRGRKGLERTIRILDSLKIPHTGTFKDSADRATTQPLVLERNGIRLSLLNYTYGTNGIAVTSPNIVNLIDTTRMKVDLDSARAQETDAIIVFLHWGAEYQSLPNKSQTAIAEFCFRNGAKLVIGAHPHVLQPMEWRRDKDQLVVYSLGNFVSGQRQRYRDGGGMLFVDLVKVADSLSSTTRIDDVAYELQYVYSASAEASANRRKYVVLPVLDFESDTTIVRDQKAQLLLDQFASDSRLLLGKHNMNVPERQLAEPEYFVTIPADSLYGVNLDSLLAHDRLMKFYSATADSVQGMTLRLGPFPEQEMAVTVQQQLAEHGHCQCARIVQRRGRRPASSSNLTPPGPR
jgi:poly-gamma-glutamate capsule biosynthesis protein CapA/YwtB (metallophosphatase superfamily)